LFANDDPEPPIVVPAMAGVEDRTSPAIAALATTPAMSFLRIILLEKLTGISGYNDFTIRMRTNGSDQVTRGRKESERRLNRSGR
jgi:hypothetical protein